MTVSRTACFVVVAFAFAYGAGWGGNEDASVLGKAPSSATDFNQIDASSPTGWRDPYPSEVWVQDDVLSAPLDDAEDASYDL